MVINTVTDLQGTKRRTTGMSNTEKAERLVVFVEGIDDFWKDLKDVIVDKFSVLGKKAEELYGNVTSSKEVFVNIVIEVIFIYKPTPKFFKPFIKWALKPVFTFLLDKIGTDWLDKVRAKMSTFRIAGSSIEPIA